MFRITNVQTRNQEMYDTRDELLSILNEKSVWAEDRHESFSLQLEQLAESGEVIDHFSITLPLQNIVEEALETFGQQREKKGFSLIKKKQKPKPLQLKAAPVSAPKKIKKLKPLQLLWKLLTLTSLAVALFALSYTFTLSSQNNQLEKRLVLQESQGKVEVVARYFIANYFSGDSNRLTDFLSKNLKAEGIAAKKGEQIQSNIYESIEESKGIISVTFVVTLKGEDNQITSKRLILPFKKDSKSVYGYVLDGQPKFSSFGN